MEQLTPNPDGLEQACVFLCNDQVVAYPTETVYGLGANPFSSHALQHLFQTKQREPGRAILLIAADLSQVSRVARPLSRAAAAIAEVLWPGPISLLLPPAKDLPAELLGPAGKVCVRIPGLDIARRLCEVFDSPITSTSANLSGRSPARRPQDCRLEGVAAVIDAGELACSPPSTVFDPESSEVLREGAIPAEKIAAVTGQPVRTKP